MADRTSSVACACLLAFLVLPSTSIAATLTLNPESITRYTSYPGHPNLTRSFTNNALLGDSHRHVMIFDLIGVDGEIVGATLQIEEGLGTQVSISTSRTYSVWDVTSPINTVAQFNSGNVTQNIFDDIGSGTRYGISTFAVQPTNGAYPLPSPGVTVDLSGGLADLNAELGGFIAFGGASPQTFYIFNGSVDLGKITLTLDVEPSVVPIPAAAWLFASHPDCL